MLELAVLGNLSLDRVNDGGITPGGCPIFTAITMPLLGSDVQVLTRCAAEHRAFFELALAGLGVQITFLPARITSAFGLRYNGEQRAITIEAVGETWDVADCQLVDADVRWVHVASLVRSDFGVDALTALAHGGRYVSLDGQGLVRVPRVGPLTQDADFDATMLEHVQALKLSAEEAAVVAGGRFDEQSARNLGVPEVLVTLGSQGSIVYAKGRPERVPADSPVFDVQATGSGDAFMVGYGAARCHDAEPVEAARSASEVVARMLEERKLTQ